MIENISDNLTIRKSDGKVKLSIANVSTNWLGEYDMFFDRLENINLNPVFLDEHLAFEIKVKNILDEAISNPKPSKAIELLDRVIYYDENYAEALINKSYALRQQKHFVKALRYYKKAVKSDRAFEDVGYFKKLLSEANAERDDFPKLKRNIYAGDEYFSNWGLSSQPVGLVDRAFDATPLSFTDWAAVVNYEIGFKAPVSFMTTSTYDAASQQASIEVQTIGLDSARVTGKLQVWLVEDSIDSFQYMPDGSMTEHYNHMHVFRASVNDTWGDDVVINHGEVVTKSYNLAMDPSWVPEHCSIVTFLYDENGVRQVFKTKLNY